MGIVCNANALATEVDVLEQGVVDEQPEADMFGATVEGSRPCRRALEERPQRLRNPAKVRQKPIEFVGAEEVLLPLPHPGAGILIQYDRSRVFTVAEAPRCGLYISF